MKTLKRSLAIMLALCMALSMTAFAAKVPVYTDAEDINFREAVEVLTAMGIVEGENGAFDPDGMLTRAYAAKMITRMVVGTKVADALQVSEAPFADVPADHPAAPYIAYCAAEGLLAGRGDGSFAPDEGVTSGQFALLLLRACGYGRNNEYTGASWSIKVNADALKLGIFKNHPNVQLSAPATREEGCLYAFNTLMDVYVVQYLASDDVYMSSGRTLADVLCPGYAKRDYSDAFGRQGYFWINHRGEQVTEGIFDKPDLIYTTAVSCGRIYADLGLEAAVDARLFVNGAEHGNMTLSDQNTYKLGGNGTQTEVYCDADGNITVIVIDTYVARVTDREDDVVTLQVWQYNTGTGSEMYARTTESLKKGDFVLVTVAGGEVRSISKPQKVTGRLEAYDGTTTTLGGVTYRHAAGLDQSQASPLCVPVYDMDMNLLLDEYGYMIALMPVTASFDLANGSITVGRNYGITTFRQGNTEVRTFADSGIIRQSNNTTPTANTITVEHGEVSLTVSGIHMAPSQNIPLELQNDTVLTLNLLGENRITAPSGRAGIEVTDDTELIIRGTGSLYVTGGTGNAAIGSRAYSGNLFRNNGCGRITIHGGTITAIGGEDGAGIGGGSYTHGGNVTISGGTVNATGGRSCAGIGGGSDGNGGSVTISGGTVNATSGRNGAGIGGGSGGSGGEITITGGTVTATSGEFYGAGIGGGNGGNGGEITITGGTVTAIGRNMGVGIGGGKNGHGGNVAISNANVTVMGYEHAIGGGGTDNKYGCDSVIIEENAVVELSCISANGSKVQEKITDNTDLSDAAAHAGNAVSWAAEAEGASGLSYQWQVSADNKTWTDVAGAAEATAYIPVHADNDRYYYRCALTNGWGNTVYAEAARAYILAFVKQPTSVDAELDDLVAFEVTPSCNNVTYRWQRSYDDGASWSDIEGETYSTLLFSAAMDDANAKYRCVITAANGDQLASDMAEIHLDLSDLITYTVSTYLQKPDGTGYDRIKQEVLEGEPGETVTAPAQTFDGFFENIEKSVPSGIVAADSSLEIGRYFDRETYEITFETNGGTEVPAIRALYGASVAAPAVPVRYGYAFGGWFADADLTEEVFFDTMPLGGMTVYAKWELVGADRGIEYTIERMGMYDVDTRAEYTAIPQAQFFTEVEIRNTASTQIDAVMLVQYSHEGQMLGLQYLYGHMDIGRSAIFGAMIDNRAGEIGCIKAFVVPTVDSMVPLAESMEIR